MAGIEREPFGKTPDGTAVERYTLRNARGTVLRAITYGARITALEVADRDGRRGDVVLGYDTLEGYLADTSYQGALVGRYGNRIAHGRFTLGGREFSLARNNGPNHLHGGRRGFDAHVWTARPAEDVGRWSVGFERTSPDGEEGYPGTLRISAHYTLADDDSVEIAIRATTDAPTPVNLTQHAYFNLRGGGDVLGHELAIAAGRIVEVDDTLIPTGALREVRGTPFDFTRPQAIGARIAADDPQLVRGRGYDHTYVLDRDGASLARAAFVREPGSGRTLEVLTTEPGVQFYSGNFLDGTSTGKGGRALTHRSGFCLETQHFPDSPNQPQFPSTILEPGALLRTETVWRFGTDRAR